jgi:hypothetical protein
VFGAKHTAKTRRRFIENVIDVGASSAVFFEFEGGGQSGNASADDGDASHGLRIT